MLNMFFLAKIFILTSPQRIAFTDKKIDALVYELYGLSEEEVKIVEGIEKEDAEV